MPAVAVAVVCLPTALPTTFVFAALYVLTLLCRSHANFVGTSKAQSGTGPYPWLGIGLASGGAEGGAEGSGAGICDIDIGWGMYVQGDGGSWGW